VTEKLTPRPAATLLLLREAQAAPEVFMLQRTAKAAFLPGAYVFPGGALDSDDASDRSARRVRGLDDAQASARMGEVIVQTSARKEPTAGWKRAMSTRKE